MRKRNNIVFNLVESERDYVHQLEILVANYVRPFRMGKKNEEWDFRKEMECIIDLLLSSSC